MPPEHGSAARIRVEPGDKRIRAYLGGELVVDTTHPLLVWEGPHYPVYYFPAEDVRSELLQADGGLAHSPSRGDGRTFTIAAGGRQAAGAALRYDSSPIEELRGLVRLDWDAMDAWFEEDEDGVTVAESASPRLLFETGLPVRYYLPRTHVRMDLLELAEAVSHCPYKGQAQSWSVRLDGGLHENQAWSYPTPLPESEKIAGLMAFYNEKVDIHVEGVLQERPRTKFS